MDIHQEAWAEFQTTVLQHLRDAKHLRLESQSHHVVQYLVVPAFSDVVSLDIVMVGQHISATRTVWSVNEDAPRFRSPVEFLKHRAQKHMSLQTVRLETPESKLRQVVGHLQQASHPVSIKTSRVQLDGVNFELVFTSGEEKWTLTWRGVDDDRLPRRLQNAVAELRSFSI